MGDLGCDQKISVASASIFCNYLQSAFHFIWTPLGLVFLPLKVNCDCVFCGEITRLGVIVSIHCAQKFSFRGILPFLLWNWHELAGPCSVSSSDGHHQHLFVFSSLGCVRMKRHRHLSTSDSSDNESK